MARAAVTPRRPAGAPILALLALLAMLLVPYPAAAHTELEESSPTPGSRLDRPPQEISLRFSEAISADFAQMTLGRADRRVTKLSVRVDGSVVTGALPASLRRQQEGSGPEQWRVGYRVVSADGHPVTGTIPFRVAGAKAGLKPSPSVGSTTSPSATADQPLGAGDKVVPAADDATSSTGDSSSGGRVALIAVVAAAVVAALAALLRRRQRTG